ncbi:MAG: carboxypeptidase regulatory-like domain-containing protein [Colwellia sp.]
MLHKLKVNWLFIKRQLPFICLSLVISGCGGGGDNDTSPTPTPEPPTATTYTITGYAEDDPLVNATITISTESGEKLTDVTTDANGMYALTAAVEKDLVYMIEVVGELSGKTVTMHSQFIFDGSDSQININPLTELKYQLVKNHDQTLAQAEALVRDYFMIIKGESLEAIRFSTTDKAYIGLKDIAEIYNASLPIEAIEKVKEDIVRNDLSSTGQVKDYSYKNLVEQSIALDVSATSLALNEELTIKIQGIETLNENYTLVWSGLPEEGVTGNDISKIFTTSEYAQDIYISATLYKVNGENKVYIASASENINFYKPLEEVSALVEDSTIDNEYTISDSLKMKAPAGTLTNGVEIKITELQTNSETTLAQFAIDSNAGSTDTVIIEYNYDPYQVSEPRNLQVSLQGDEPKVINVSEIDYVNHVVKFEISLSTLEARAWGNNSTVIIQQLKTKPTLKKINKLIDDYGDYIKDVAKKYHPNNHEKLFVQTIDRDQTTYSEELIRAKIAALLMKQDNNGEYKFNVLTSSINNIIAWNEGENIFNDHGTWHSAFEGYLRCTEWDEDYECSYLWNVYKDKLVDINRAIAMWVGHIKLDDDQINTLKYAKLVTKMTIAAVSLDPATFLSESVGVTLDLAIEDLPTDTQTLIQHSYANMSEAIQSMKTAKDINILHNLGTGMATGFVVDKAFSFWANSMKKENAVKTAPIIFPLSETYNQSFDLMTDPNYRTYWPGLDDLKMDLLNIWFPESENPYGFGILGKEFSQQYKTYFSDLTSQEKFGNIDNDNRLHRLFLTNDLSEEQRELAYEMLKYSFGDEDAKELFGVIKNASEIQIDALLLEAHLIPEKELTNERTYIKNKFWSGEEYSKTLVSIDSSFTNSDGTWYWKSTADSKTIETVSNIESFTSLMEKAKFKFTNEQFASINITSLSVVTKGVDLTYSETDHLWVPDIATKVNYTFKVTDNINQQFVFNSESNKNELSFATLFAGEDFAQFDNKLVGFKILLTYEKSGVDKIESADFVFTTLADNENLTETNFIGATLKSSVKDAVTGDALAGAFVTLNPGGLSSFTDGNGDYEVSNLAAGEYTIIITKPGYKQIEASLTLTEDETKIYEVSLSIDNDSATTFGTTNITIKDAYNGSILTNGYISLREGQNNKTSEVTQTINSDGESSLELTLFPGHYTIEAGANGYAKSYSTVTIVGGTNITKEVSISPVLDEDQLRAVLTWGESPYDLESHLIKKINGVESYHVYYSNMAPANADASLDTDDVSSYGPETVTINNIDPNAIYTYYVYNFSGGEDNVLPDSGAKIDIYSGESTQTLFIPNKGGQYWKVFEIVNGEISPCTENCVRATDDGIARSINSEALIFKNLPQK